MKEAATHGICSMDAEFGYTAAEALEALPHVKRVIERIEAEHASTAGQSPGPQRYR